ncbi:MAG TPA: hypothetical protein VK766_12090 [Cytophagaceae bacterium]|jgi:hypothetical protein|nr:hypothetical protein [Cytophagaceae bacterium]
MDKYSIKRSSESLTDEEINRHKDFDKLLREHKKIHRYKDAVKPLYKNIGFMGVLIIISVVLLTVFFDQQDKTQKKIIRDSVSTLKADTGIKVPLEEKSKTANRTIVSAKKSMGNDVEWTKTEIPIVYEVYTIHPEAGAILYLKSGARIRIPSFAFVDQKGNVIKKEITFYYRELTGQEEVDLKLKNDLYPEKIIEIKAEESGTKFSTVLASPIEIEIITPLKKEPGSIYHYSKEKQEWILSGNEKIVYRFLIQAQETEFPEMTPLKGLVWELPDEAGKPLDFGYIFNRPWKSCLFKTTDKKELFIKNTNSSYKSPSDILCMLGDKKQDKKLKEAFYVLYHKEKVKDMEGNQEAVNTIENWRKSIDGQNYFKWVTDSLLRKQFFSENKTSVCAIKKTGFNGLFYNSPKSLKIKSYKRLLVLEKYPNKNQHFSREMIWEEPSLKR